MIVYDLVCAQEHRFEGWFASADDYALQRERTLVRCPIVRRRGDRAPAVGQRAGRSCGGARG